MTQTIAFGILGVGAIAYGIYLLFTNSHHLRVWYKTTGRVTDLKDDGFNRYYPVIEFSDLNNKPVKVVSDFGSSPSIYSVGDEIKLYYNPANTTEILLDNLLYRLAIPLVIFAVGIFIACASFKQVL